jgi:hypothetical protein
MKLQRAFEVRHEAQPHSTPFSILNTRLLAPEGSTFLTIKRTSRAWSLTGLGRSHGQDRSHRLFFDLSRTPSQTMFLMNKNIASGTVFLPVCLIFVRARTSTVIVNSRPVINSNTRETQSETPGIDKIFGRDVVCVNTKLTRVTRAAAFTWSSRLFPIPCGLGRLKIRRRQ